MRRCTAPMLCGSQQESPIPCHSTTGSQRCCCGGGGGGGAASAAAAGRGSACERAARGACAREGGGGGAVAPRALAAPSYSLPPNGTPTLSVPAAPPAAPRPPASAARLARQVCQSPPAPTSAAGGGSACRLCRVGRARRAQISVGGAAGVRALPCPRRQRIAVAASPPPFRSVITHAPSGWRRSPFTTGGPRNAHAPRATDEGGDGWKASTRMYSSGLTQRDRGVRLRCCARPFPLQRVPPLTRELSLQ